ncbi:uncharacterized protein [Apostichopus japonicus]|uniref:uncharacterized protein isoform X5 n=1 Tax=Stichopus japonicus TaxID=307972 RepID=UPI003AB9160B
MVVTTKMNSAPLPPLRPDSEQLVDLHVYQVPEEVWNLKYRSAYNEVINETISIGFVRVWPELSIWNLRTELLNQLGPDCVPGEFVYVRSVGRCLTKVKGRQELELKVKAFLPPRNFAPEIFILEAPQDVPDTALIEASKQETATREDEGASSMEIDGENDKDEETNVEKGKDRRIVKSLKWSQKKEKKKVEFKVQNKPTNKLKGIIKAVPAGNNVKPSSSIKQGRTAPQSSRRDLVTKSLTMNKLKSLQEKEIIAKRSRPPLKNGIVAATLRDTKGRKPVPINNNQRNYRLVSKPVISAEAKVRIRTPENVKNTLRSKVIKTKIGDDKTSAGIVKNDKPLVEKPTARRIPKPLKYTEPHHSDTTPSEGRDYEQRESPRKGGRQETFTKHTNSDSGLGEQTPEEISERIQRENHGPQTTSKDLESSRQPHYENDGHLPIGKDRIQEHEDPDLRHRSEHQGYFKDSPRGGYQNNQNYDSPRTQRPPQYEEGPGPDQRPMENYTGGYSHRDPSVPGQGHTQQPGGSYEDDESPRGVYQPSRGPGRSMGQGNHDHRYQEERYDPQGEHSSGFQESVNAWEEGRPHDGQDGGMDDARNTQKAMAYLQLSSDHAPSPKLYPRLPSSDSPSEASSSAVSSSNPEKQRIMSQMKEEQQARLDMEKIREELIKKAKSLQGKTIDRRKKDGMTEMLQARDYWKKRYYDEKKKTPGLEDQVAKLANQVQLQNRKLMSHLEGKGAKAPKGPPSKRMDHKIQIFKHQYDLDDVKRQVDNARMKLGTEIKLRTQAETELRILKSEVTQKKINVTLKRGKQLQAVQKSSGGKLTYQTPRPTGR